MKKILSVIITLMLLFGLCTPLNFLNDGVVFAKTEKGTAVFIAATFRKVGYDWDGKTLLDPPRDFPWQKPGQMCWGRPGYYMPDASKARNTSTGLPVPVTKKEDGTLPMYYTLVYLDVTAEGGLSTESNPYYAVVDSVGQLWFDPDGFFNDGRYDPTADPLYPKAPFEIHIQNGAYIPGNCSVNPRAIIDTSPDTNTKGPYYLNKFSEFYSTRQYFWDYKKDETSNASNRMWRIGWADLVDYPFKGATLPDGSVSDGLVKYDTIKKIGDWDYKLPLVTFADNEYHTEIIADGAYTPGIMSESIYGEATVTNINNKLNGNSNKIRPSEFIYRKPYTIDKGRIIVELSAACVSGTTIEVYDMNGNIVAKGQPDAKGIYDTGCLLKCPGTYTVIPRNYNFNFSPEKETVKVPCCPDAANVWFGCAVKRGKIIARVPSDCVSGTTIYIYDEKGNLVAKGQPDAKGIYDTGCVLNCPGTYTVIPRNDSCNFSPEKEPVYVPCCPEASDVKFECKCEKYGKIVVTIPTSSVIGTTIYIYDENWNGIAKGQPDANGVYDTGCVLKCPGNYIVVPTNNNCSFDPEYEEVYVPCCPEQAEIKFGVSNYYGGALKIVVPDTCVKGTTFEIYNEKGEIVAECQPDKSGVYEIGCVLNCPGTYTVIPRNDNCRFDPEKAEAKVPCCPKLLTVKFGCECSKSTSKSVEVGVNKDNDCGCDDDKSLNLTESLMQPIDSIVVEVGDMRLTPVTIRRGEVTKTYPADTIVQDGDWDVGLLLISFSSTEKHADNIVSNNQFDSDEWIYSVTDPAVTNVPAGAIRLTNVNTKRYESGGRLALDLGCGLYMGDALVMMEVFEGGCHTPTYDVSVLTDLWMGQSPSFTAARLRSPNNDIPEASQRIQKATVLDPGLDPERYYLLPGTTFNNLHFSYREYIGVEIFLDNGVDNSIGINDPNDFVTSLDLSDNYREGRTSELFLGAKSGIGTLDLGRRLERIKLNYKFYNASGEIPPRYGCGEAIYYVADPNRYVILAGDKRFTDVDLVVGGVYVSYKRNTVVADGDADVGLELQDFGKEKLFIPNLDSISPEYSAPFDYDPAIDDIYYDANDNYVVDMGDIRLTDVEVEDFTYTCGSVVTASDNYFLPAPVNMITIGKNGNYNYIDAEIVPGDIGLKVNVDPPLKVEQTSTITISVDPPPKEDEVVYVSIQSPEANEFNIFRDQAITYNQEFVDHDYNIKGTPMHWYDDDKAWVYELPFEFPFMGRFYNRVYVSSNGFLNFSSSYPMPLGLNDFDARLMVYGDDLNILPSTDPACITSNLPVGLINYDPEDIYILKTNDSITFRWRAQTKYEVPFTGRPEDNGSYTALNGIRYALIDASVTLFSDGAFKFSYLKDVTVGSTQDHIWKLYNRVNNVSQDSWVISGSGGIEPTEPIVGITNGSGVYAASPYSSLKNVACVDGAYVVIGGTIYVYADPWGRRYDQKSRFYADEKWTPKFMPFNEPSSLYPNYDEWKPYEDFRVLTADNPIASFTYTPYRGTCLETGIPQWVEVRAYKDIGGRTIAPPDCSYTFIPQFNFYDPTVWDSKWTKQEYWNYPWGIFQKTKYFIYPPITPMMPKELAGVYDCFGIDRLQVEPEELKLVPSKSCVNSLDERQPALWLDIYDADNPADVNDPQGMKVATYRKTLDALCATGSTVQVDYGLTDAWYPPTISTSPVGATWLTIQAPYFNLFSVGDIVYIEPVPEYRRITGIDKNLRRIYFDLPLIASHGVGTQVVPNPIIGNYNIKGGGIKGLFTTIGGAGQRYIVQVRDDGSYDYWRWYEPLVMGQVRGALDPNDLLYSWQNTTIFDRSENCPNVVRTPFPYPNARPALGLEDLDCSLGQSICSICGDTTEFPKLGEWSSGDRYGAFGNLADGHAVFPNSCTVAYAYGSIWTWGVPVLILPNKTPVPTENIYDDGGKCIIAAWPQDPETPMNIRLYLNTTLYDYNSKIKHPPHFVLDTGYGIDYCGEVSIRVSKPNPLLNFSELTIIDHALQNSKLNYTMGDQALSPLPPPNPQIAARYYPIARNLNKDLRSYPGGQTNTGRIVSRLGLFNAENPSGNVWNAYPAIWEDQFVKLGTEFMPMTDYGIAFYLKGAENPYDKYSFFGSGNQRIIKVEIEGPFAFPRTFTEDLTRGRPGQPDLYSFRLNSGYEFNEYKNVPLDYDFSGKLVIDGGNYNKYELTPASLFWYADTFLCATLPTGPTDFRMVTNPIAPFDAVNYPLSEINPWLRLDNKWFYWGAFRFPNTIPYWYTQTVFLIDELIPVGAGPLKINVTMSDGAVVSYTDCCEEPPITEIPIHGIKIEDAPKTLEIEEDHNFSVTLTEGYIPEQDTEYCNDAFLIVWQDRGIIEPTTGRIVGMGDGHIANPPRSSNWYKTGHQFPKHMDINLDGKVSFADYETEVMGTYDLATNTWSSGVTDGRTFMREYGIYNISLSADKGSQLTTIGYDFGGIPDESGDFDKKQDHVISEYEVLPIYINAYKYADDNNDRGFTPLWRPVAPYEYSHEVYLSGMVKIIPAPHNDYIVSYTPDPLTAGVTPELVDPSKPLTFVILDEDGNPVNLRKGVPDKDKRDFVLDRNVWNVLFKDPHPDNKEFFGMDAKLPQYYWIRTDLQNNDGTLYDNESIYFSTITPFDPISVDFSLATEGKYKFFNFCANDAGSFLVRVYSPDRRHYGETTVSVKLPSVSYKIINDEDPEGIVFEVPGTPDFVLTAVDKRIYTIEAHVLDAQGDVLKGKTGAQICTTEDGRFTPITTFLRNFRYPAGDVYAGTRYYNLIGVDKNENGSIEPLNFERVAMDGFGNVGGAGLYNTQNAINPLHGGFYTGTVTDIPPEYVTFAGWGLGCIYNSVYKGGYCIADLDRNNQLTFNDSLDLDQEGKVRFKFYANDMGLTESFLGGFIGKNKLTSVPAWGDVAGHPGGFEGDPFAPFDTWRRFRYSGARFLPNFALDWDAHPDIYVSIKGPEMRLLNAKTRQPLGKELLNTESYDLTYGVPNHIIVQVLPADSRDLPIKENGEVVVYGGEHERYIRALLKNGIDGIPETLLTYTPTGTGASIGYIDYIRMNGGYDQFDDNLNVGLSQYTYFDSSLGLALDVSALGDLYPRKKVTLRIKVYEGAANTPIDSASVRATGAGVNEGGNTNSSGICELNILPTEEGEIVITATKEKYLPGSEVVYIGKDTRPLFLYVDPTPELTKDDTVTFAGYTKSTATLSINGESVQLDSKGNFSVKLPLTEGENNFKIIATYEDQRKEENRSITRDSTPPDVEVFDPGTLVDVKEALIKGKVSEKGAMVVINGKTAEVIGFEWQITIPVEYGKNILTITAKDKIGNEKTISKDIYIFRKLIVEVQLGSKTVYLNGVPQAPLSTPPYLKDGKMMVPLRIISEILGGKAEWNPDTKEVKITFDDKVVSMVIGSNIAIVNGEALSLDTPPEIIEGTTFVPLRFIGEAFGFTVEWIESSKTAKITRLI